MKRADFDFSVMFALIVGAAILALAIYGAIKLGELGQYRQTTETAVEITILTDPLQAGPAEASYSKISSPTEFLIENGCNAVGFGRNEIRVLNPSKNSFVGGEKISVYDKYIFSASERGKEFYVLSMPFEFPYKVADLLFLTSKKYCFIEPPRDTDIEQRLLGLGMKNVQVGKRENCSSDAVKVCFGVTGGCGTKDIIVSGTCLQNCENAYEEGHVDKNGTRVYYVGNLMYAAIFSDKNIYDCNVKRLLYRDGRIAQVYSGKTELMNARGCNTRLKQDLDIFSSRVLEESKKIEARPDLLTNMEKQLKEKQDNELCKIW